MTALPPLLMFAGLGAGGLRNPWVWTLFAVLSWAAALRTPRRAPLPGGRLWAAALAWGALSAVLSPEPLLSAAAFAYAATVWLWLDLGATAADDEARAVGLALLAGTAAVAAAAALAVDVPGYRGVGLFFPYYNYTAALAAAAGAGAAALPGWPGAFGPALAGAFLLWTGSRGGLAALAVGAGLAAWRSGRRAPVFLAALAVGGFLAIPSPARDRVLKSARPSSHQRPAIWRAALAVAAESPWLGEGPGRFSRGSLRHQTPAPAAMGPARFPLRADRPHSELLNLAAEGGFVSLALVLAALAALWRARRAAEASLSREGLLAAAAALATQASADSVFALPALGWLFAWTLGASCAPAGSGPPRPAAAYRPALAGGLALAAVAWWPGWAVGSRRSADPAAALALAPSDDGLWQDLARARLKAGDAGGALAALARAAELAPYSAPARVMAGEVLRTRGAWGPARAMAEEALSLEPACGQAYLLKAEAELRLGLPDDARRTLAALSASRARPLPELGEHRDRLIVGYDPARDEALRSELGVR